MKKIIVLIANILFVTILAQAQTDSGSTSSYYTQNSPQTDKLKPKPSFKSRLRFGGNIGATFGSFNYVQLAPAVGYAVTDNFMLGVGLTYYYQWYKNSGYPARHIYGGRVFARQYILRELFNNNNGALFLHAEYEPLSVPYYDTDTKKTTREIVNTVYLGGGIIVNHFTISALYIVNYDEDKSPYADPLQVRIGFFF